MTDICVHRKIQWSLTIWRFVYRRFYHGFFQTFIKKIQLKKIHIHHHHHIQYINVLLSSHSYKVHVGFGSFIEPNSSVPMWEVSQKKIKKLRFIQSIVSPLYGRNGDYIFEGCNGIQTSQYDIITILWGSWCYKKKKQNNESQKILFLYVTTVKSHRTVAGNFIVKCDWPIEVKQKFHGLSSSPRCIRPSTDFISRHLLMHAHFFESIQFEMT